MNKITTIRIHPHQIDKFVVHKFTHGSILPGYSVNNLTGAVLIIERHGSDQITIRNL